jgi:hypothetical protein
MYPNCIASEKGTQCFKVVFANPVSIFIFGFFVVNPGIDEYQEGIDFLAESGKFVEYSATLFIGLKYIFFSLMSYSIFVKTTTLLLR